MILRKIPFVNKKHYSPGGPPVVAAECGQRICWKIQNGGANNRDSVLYYIRKDVNIERLWFYTTYTRVCQRNFIYLISILAKFVLFEYNHVVIVIESQYRESDFYDLGWERLSLTILMSQYDIIMYIIYIYAKLNLFIKSLFKLLINLLH